MKRREASIEAEAEVDSEAAEEADSVAAAEDEAEADSVAEAEDEAAAAAADSRRDGRRLKCVQSFSTAFTTFHKSTQSNVFEVDYILSNKYVLRETTGGRLICKCEGR